MKILFSLGSFGFLRNFEPAIRQLAQRGHDIHLLAERKDSVGGIRTLELLERDYPERIRHSYSRLRKDAWWQPLATQFRLTLDYWRYLDPRYDRSPSLRARGAARRRRRVALCAAPLLGSRRRPRGDARASCGPRARVAVQTTRSRAFLREDSRIFCSSRRCCISDRSRSITFAPRGARHPDACSASAAGIT